MNKIAQLKPAELGTGNSMEVHRIARAMDHVLTCLGAVPNYPANAHVLDHYKRQYQELCGEMLGALHG